MTAAARIQPPAPFHQEAALPANVEAEAAFLGAVLIDNRVLEELTTPLSPAHFFEPVHGRIYERIAALIGRGDVVTPVTLRPYFEADEGLKELGGLAYLARLTADGQGLLAPRELAEQIRDLAIQRELVAIGRDLVEAAADTSEDGTPGALLAELRRRLEALEDDTAGSGDYGLLTLADLADLPAKNWLIKGLIGTDSFGTIYGPPKSLKSFLAIDLGLHIAHGLRWHGRDVKPGAVVYIAGEGAAGVKARIEGWHVHHGRTMEAPFWVMPHAVPLLQPAAVQRLRGAIERNIRATGEAVQLIIVDTLSRSIPGADENATDVMTGLIAACDALGRHFGATVLAVHHSGKDKAKGQRGNSALLGAVDFSLRVERADSIVTLHCEAQKDAEEADALAFDMAAVEWWPDGSAEGCKTLVPVLADSAPTAASGPKLTGHNKTAFETIQRLITLAGQPLPDTIPADVVDRQREARGIASGHAADKVADTLFAVVGGAEDKRADTAKRTARRAIKSLKDAGILETWGDWLWLK